MGDCQLEKCFVGFKNIFFESGKKCKLNHRLDNYNFLECFEIGE